MEITKKLSFANTLTLIRLLISPLTLPFLIVYLAHFNSFVINCFVALLFIAFASTDFFDGYYARKWGNTSRLGAALDPIADKFLLYTTLIALLAAGKIYFFWVILLIGREFFVMGLRIVALEHNVQVPVSWTGKIKTVIEMIYLVVLILQTSAREWFWYENILLICSLGLAFLSAYWYLDILRVRLGLDQRNGTI